jgi:putative phosphoribosyl transferase
MLVEIPQLHNKVRVFEDREAAGGRLSEMLSAFKNSSAIILALPAGGIPVASVIAEKLGLKLDVVVVSKITPPFNSEVGFGAVAFDGTVRLNERTLAGFGLSKVQVQQRIDLTMEKVARRMREFRGNKPLPDLSDKPAIVVDDGVASGLTMQVAVEAVAKLGAKRIIIVVPTGHSESLSRLIPMAETLYCANVRTGCSFAVADAYKNWYDVTEDEAAQILNRFNPGDGL